MPDDFTKAVRVLLVDLVPPTFPPSTLMLATLTLAAQMASAQMTGSSLSRIHALKPASAKQAVKELEKFCKALETFNDATRGLSKTAHDGIEAARVELTGTGIPSVGILQQLVERRALGLSP